MQVQRIPFMYCFLTKDNCKSHFLQQNNRIAQKKLNPTGVSKLDTIKISEVFISELIRTTENASSPA
jgi:hypothetical protein